MNVEEKKLETGISPLWYVLGGAIAGTAIGMLLAPKTGKEMRHDIAEWSKKNGERGKALLAKLGEVEKTPVNPGFARRENGEKLFEAGKY